MHIAIINGPNLNLLGKREPHIYGSQTFEGYLEELKNKFPEVTFSYFQSNVEGELISQIQKADSESTGIVLNAAAYTHTSIGLGDAISGINTPVIEVHISNIYSREEYRHQSYLTGKCAGVISGLGLKSYELAIRFLIGNANL
jgi:3-dehydroquinate dehydratase-2